MSTVQYLQQKNIIEEPSLDLNEIVFCRLTYIVRSLMSSRRIWGECFFGLFYEIDLPAPVNLWFFSKTKYVNNSKYKQHLEEKNFFLFESHSSHGGWVTIFRKYCTKNLSLPFLHQFLNLAMHSIGLVPKKQIIDVRRSYIRYIQFIANEFIFGFWCTVVTGTN